MRIDQLIREALVGAGLAVSVVGDPTVEVSTVTSDSRTSAPGALFACVPGLHSDGHTFAPAAVRAGATALLVERVLDLDVPQIIVASTRAAVGPVASAVYGHPSRALTVVGITGTNGKTTTATLLAAILNADGQRAAALGTLTQERTTPEAPVLQGRLADLRDEGFVAVAMEVSSHALDQRRVDGIVFAAGVLTNVTQDHLDYHGTMERYFEAKATLFEPGRCAAAVVNRDDPWGAVLLARLRGAGGEPVEFGLADAADLEIGADGSRFTWEGHPVRLHLGGRFNVLNALAAARTAQRLGVAGAEIAAGLEAVASVRGRFEPVEVGQDFTVLVDYAHTPDGLGQALAAARELSRGRLLVVFGAGGDRDQEKRPLMGEVAARLADLAVVTSDNPRSEDPEAIIEAVVAGADDRNKVLVDPDRAHAIDTALRIADAGDVVLIAGKGHEQGQETAGHVRPFDDVTVAREVLARIVVSRRARGGAR